ncbi:SRPBCC domain-containing protein [Altererythrobacter aquiaggeris]|uniref:SRPBCC family protein n=1 Tax=Aestuarierythrobacter aquiaggeris TaxID=1898396 RepID=UPI003015C487
MTDTPVFTITCVFDAPIGDVFDAWADPDKMAAWSGPPGAKLTLLSGEISEGSLMHTRSDHDEMGTNYTLALWTAVQPTSRIAWEQSFADEAGNKIRPSFVPRWPLTLLTDVRFEEVDGGTRVTLTWTPVEATAEDLAEFTKQMASMKGGWSGSFDKLAEFLAAG